MATAAPQDFRSMCRQWRRFRKLSQLDLALSADVSQRHVSWLETGRSRPSRDMVLRLSDALDVPLRERNALLRAAGYAAAYRETPLDETAMRPVLDALNHVLQHHEPLPALVVDRGWNVKMTNPASARLLRLGGDPEEWMQEIGGGGEVNLALLTLHPQGLRRFIVNWDQVAPVFVRRLKRESLAAGDPEAQARLARFIELVEPAADADPATAGLLPVLPVRLRIDDVELSLFSVIATFGTPQDVTTDELRIEAFYPADAETARFFRGRV